MLFFIEYFVYFEIALAFILGAIIGSFLNVAALRYNTGRSLKGRSACSACSRVLVWYELVPVASFLFLGGRCRTCHAGLSVQYPLVELVTGLLFAGLFLKMGLTFSFAIFAFFFSLYVVIGVYDLKHLIVPNGLSYTAALLAFAWLFVDSELLALRLPNVWELLAGPLVALPIFVLWLISKGKWMGLGDAKLMLSIGWLLGVLGGIAAFFVAAWAGALFGLGYILVSRMRMERITGTNSLLIGGRMPTMKSEIPFAPFLLLGFFTVFFFEANLLSLFLWPF